MESKPFSKLMRLVPQFTRKYFDFSEGLMYTLNCNNYSEGETGAI